MTEDPMNLFFFFNMLRNIISIFFENTILVVGFFFLLNKTFDNERLRKISIWIIGIISLIILIYAILSSV